MTYMSNCRPCMCVLRMVQRTSEDAELSVRREFIDRREGGILRAAHKVARELVLQSEVL